MMQENNTKFCFKCGKPITLNTDFCPFCGAKQASSIVENKNNQFLIWGWITAVLALFIPLTGIVSFVLSIFIIKNKRTTAGTVLLVFTIIFFYLGMTGFSDGFFGAM